MMNYSKNQKPAKDFLRWVSSKPVFEQWFTSQQGYTDGPTLMWEEDKVWSADPVLLPFRDLPRKGRLMGEGRPPGPRLGGSPDQIHYCRHVREGRAGHAGRGCRQVGA